MTIANVHLGRKATKQTKNKHSAHAEATCSILYTGFRSDSREYSDQMLRKKAFYRMFSGITTNFIDL